MSAAEIDARSLPDRIVLVGFMGSGKSAVGVSLAERIGYSFRDSDAQIEESERRSVSEIFATDGEHRFRELESEWVATIEAEHRVVIATGGGMFDPPAQRARLLALGLCVWLDTPIERIWERCRESGTRPLFGDLEALRSLHAARAKNYRLAHERIEVGDRSVEQVVDAVAALLSRAPRRN